MISHLGCNTDYTIQCPAYLFLLKKHTESSNIGFEVMEKKRWRAITSPFIHEEGEDE